MATILLVDDDITTQMILQDALECEGHEVSTADDGEAALLMARKLHPDLMICDWMMPEMDGLTVCQQMKVDPDLATTFFILLTAREQVEDLVEALDSGADDFLSKPVEIKELLARVRAGLRIQNLTHKLSQTNQRVQHTLSELKKTQGQLIQSEKMSSLGQMVAGIAHEINNPVSFIHSNIDQLQISIQDLIELLHLYQQELPHPSDQLQEKLEEIEPEFLMEDVPKILTSMKSGSDRIREVVLSLRNFSRLDEEGLKYVNIHQGIDSTLLMLQHRLHPEGQDIVKVIKEYGKLPQVECYAKELNQVFLQILENAIDAFESVPDKEKQANIPTIHIRTKSLKEERVLVTIADNGPGIAESMKENIFDPFFTSKTVGKGRGLGLFISYQIIVEQHGGTINCVSSPERGAEFQIELPIKFEPKEKSEL
ncbi:MAG: response regulator [Hormoscilla sp.]